MVKYKRLQNADNPTGKYQEEAGYTLPLYMYKDHDLFVGNLYFLS